MENLLLTNARSFFLKCVFCAFFIAYPLHVFPGDFGPALVIVNGKPVPNGFIQHLAPEHIASFKILQGKEATDQYGRKGKNGVVLITLKDTGENISRSVRKKMKQEKKMSFRKDAVNDDSGEEDHHISNDTIRSKIAVTPGVTFKIEHLKNPWYLLPMNDTESIFKNLVSPDFTQAKTDTGKMIVHSSHVGRLVEYKEHPFFQGMYAAYADHRPFILSPDMIWLLISQGFARHVTHNADELRSRLVDFSGQTTLIVRNDQVKLDDAAHRWEEVFPEFTKQIREHIKEPSLVDILTSDFSTTDPVSRIASEITIMESMKPYFEFVTIRIICGIPKVTLEGTTEDWERLLEKARYLRKYDLDWWLDEIEPLLEEFVRASKKKIDKRFWRNMFKYHTLKQYGSPTVIDGWIVKFFPYDKEGRRNNLKSINNVNRLPSELVKVDVKYIEVFQDTTILTPLQFWAGFIGLQQDSENYSLRPEIGWLVRKKGEDSQRTKKMLEKEKASLWNGGMSIRVSTVPEEILEMEEIRELSINFTGKIQIPQEMKHIKIDRLNLSGEVSEAEIKKIRELFPDTELTINSKKIP